MNGFPRAAVAFAFLLLIRGHSNAAPGYLASDFLYFGTGGKIQNTGRENGDAIALDLQGRLVTASTSGGAFRVQRRSGRRFGFAENIDVLIDPAQLSAEANAVAIAPDGKIVVAGAVNFGGVLDFAVARLNPDFTLDSTFDVDGVTWVDFDDRGDRARGVTVQPDGKIIVVGVAATDSEDGWGVLRFNEDGTLDNSFDGDGKKVFDTEWIAHDVAVQDDGKIIVAGGVAVDDFDYRFQVVRMNPNGSMDGSFDGDGIVITGFGFNEAARSVAVAPDGKIVAAGHGASGGTNFQVARYLSNGMLDGTFDGDGKLVDTRPLNVHDLVVQPDGRIVVAGGYFETGTPALFFLRRYDPDGTPDATFGGGTGEVFTQFGSADAVARSLLLQADGMLIAAGDAQAARYRWDGSLDASGIATFVFDPKHQGSEATALTEADDGMLVAAGKVYRTDYDIALTRIVPDGSGVDQTFGTDDPKTGRVTRVFMGQNEEVRAVAVQPDGEIVVAGEVNADSQAQNFLAGRFESDGQFDIACSFIGHASVDFEGSDDRANAVDIAPDNKIYAAGTVRAGGSDDMGLVRLTEGCRVDKAGGSAVTPEPDYQPRRDLGADETCVGLLRQGGQVVLAGSSGNDIVLIRLRSPSRLTGLILNDTSFGDNGRATLDTGYREIAVGFAAQPDGKLIVAGTVDRGGTSDFLVARFTADGQRDLGFGLNGVAFANFNDADTATALAVRGDGTIAVAGYTITPAGIVFAIAQLTADGQPDSAFRGDGKATLTLGPLGEDLAHAVTFFGRDRLVVGGYSVVFGVRQFALAAFETTLDVTQPTTTSSTLAPGQTTTTLFLEETTTTTQTASTSSTTLEGILPGGKEVCGNCADDDGDGLTDFEDPACCVEAATMTMKKLGIAGGRKGTKLN